MARESRPSPEPPLFDLEDPGLRWRREGSRLVVERKPSVAAVAKPLAMALVFGGVGASSAWRGEWAGFLVLAAVLVLFGAAVLVAARERSTLRVGPDGCTWERRWPRRFHGRWDAGHVLGVRVRLGETPVRWGRRRFASVDLRTASGWCCVASGRRERRARELAETLSAALGVIPGGVVPDHDEGEMP